MDLNPAAGERLSGTHQRSEQAKVLEVWVTGKAGKNKLTAEDLCCRRGPVLREKARVGQ